MLFSGLAAPAIGNDLAIELWTVRPWSGWVRIAQSFFYCSSAALMLILLLRFAGWRWPLFERGLWTWVALSVLWQFFWDLYDPQSPIRWGWYPAVAARHDGRTADDADLTQPRATPASTRTARLRHRAGSQGIDLIA